MSYKFVLINSESGIPEQHWVLPTPITVGRCPTAEITLDDASISRRHCQFLIDPYGSLIVRDLGSTNGVYVDGRRVEKATLSMGAEVRIGILTMRVDLTEDEMDEISEPRTDAIYDLVDTEQVKIIQPEEERYEIG